MAEQASTTREHPAEAFDYETQIERSYRASPDSGAIKTRPQTTGISGWLLENHQLLSSVSVIIGLPATIFTLALTMNQMKAAKVNFAEEMAIQRRSTDAMLFNGFLKDVRGRLAFAGQSPEMIENPDRRAEAIKKHQIAEKLIAKQAEFVLHGVGDTQIRSMVLSILADTNGNDYFRTRLVGGRFESLVKTRGLSFNHGTVSGHFNKVLFEEMSFANASVSANFEKGFIRYSDFRNAEFNRLQMTGTQVRCTSFAGAKITGAEPALTGLTLDVVDFRGVKIVGSTSNDATVAALLASAGKGTEVLVDRGVGRQLDKIFSDTSEPKINYRLSNSNSDDWFTDIVNSDACNQRNKSA